VAIEPHTWTVRARAGGDASVAVHTDKTTLQVGPQVAFEPVDPPSALAVFVAAVAADLVGGFTRAARRARVDVENVELALEYCLENPLVHFDVIGEQGSPALARVSGTLYASGAFESDGQLSELWAATLERAPTYQTLSATVDFHLRSMRV
jgi:hypothetical protein